MGKVVHWRVDIGPLFMARDSNEHIVHEMSWQRGNYPPDELARGPLSMERVVYLWVVFQCVYCSGP